MKKISVIVPTYRPQLYLEECLISLSNQTMEKTDYEILVILNGDKDPYEDMITKMVESIPYNNINVLYSETVGVSQARNMGLDNAQGEYITFVDDDDYVSSSYLEELYINASPDIISLCYPLSFTEGSKEFKPYYITNDYMGKEANFRYPFQKARRYFSGVVYKLIHHSIIGRHRFNTSFKNGEDSIFMFAISDKYKYVSFTSQNAVYYRRIRKGSALNRRKTKREIVVNWMKMMASYNKLYFSHPRRYKLSFFVTRVLGAFHGAIEQLQLSKI